MTYRLAQTGVIEIATGKQIKKGDPEWPAYLAWLKGNKPEPAVVELEPLNSIRKRLRSQISKWRNDQERGSIIFEHAGRRWDGGLTVRDRMQETLDRPELPAGFFWTSADDEDVVVTMQELIALSVAHKQAIVAQGWAIHKRQRQMKQQIAGLDRAGLESYVIGWGE